MLEIRLIWFRKTSTHGHIQQSTFGNSKLAHDFGPKVESADHNDTKQSARGKNETHMWKFITKNEFFTTLHSNICPPDEMHLKFIQDAWFHTLFHGMQPERVVEIGGGGTRTLQPLLKRGVECWNADRFEGVADGLLMDSPGFRRQVEIGIKIAPVFVGEFSDKLPENAFDVAYSISVMEHMNEQQTLDCFRDTLRILKPGGRVYHAVDLFLDTQPLEHSMLKINALRRAVDEVGLRPIGEDEIGPTPTFKTHYATAADAYLARKWCFNSELQRLVETYQLTSLITGHEKPT